MSEPLKSLIRAWLTENNPQAADVLNRISEYAEGPRAHSGPLYHYTDARGFVGILTSRTLWLTHASFMNDPGEHDYASTIVGRALGALSAKGETHAAVVAQLRRYLHLFVEHDEVFIGSFCKNGDLLGQWRGYGALGAGYALGFDAARLERLPHHPWGGLYPVQYLDRFEESPLYPVIEQFCEAMRDEPTAVSSAPVLALSAALGVYLAIHLLRCKHPAFAEEQEWRFVHLVSKRGNLNETKWRAAGSEIRPYVEILLASDDGGLPLKEVVCGPTTDRIRAEKSLRMFLEQNKLEAVTIRTSTVPFRVSGL